MCSSPCRKPYPSDVSDEEWSLVVSYLTLMTEAAPQRDHSLRELFNALRTVIRYMALPGAPCRTTLQPGGGVSAVASLAGFGKLAQDLRVLLRLAAGRPAEPSAAIIDSRTLRSTPESGTRAGYDGAK